MASTPINKVENIGHRSPTLEVHGEVIVSDKLLLDIRPYICAHGLCILHYKRSHRRISKYNWNKIRNLNIKQQQFKRNRGIIHNCKTNVG